MKQGTLAGLKIVEIAGMISPMRTRTTAGTIQTMIVSGFWARPVTFPATKNMAYKTIRKPTITSTTLSSLDPDSDSVLARIR